MALITLLSFFSTLWLVSSSNIPCKRLVKEAHDQDQKLCGFSLNQPEICNKENYNLICGEHCSDEYDNLAKYNYCPNDEEVCGESWFILGDEVNDHEYIKVDFDDLD